MKKLGLFNEYDRNVVGNKSLLINLKTFLMTIERKDLVLSNNTQGNKMRMTYSTSRKLFIFLTLTSALFMISDIAVKFTINQHE